MSERKITWMNGRQFVVSEETQTAFKRVNKDFNCRLCGRFFIIGDIARWVYANGTPGIHTGNFFVCEECDKPNDELLPLAEESLSNAIKLAKQWGIYGPDWERR